MNSLSIDYGSKRIGLAYSLNSLIFTLPAIKNDDSVFATIQSIIIQYSIEKVFVGLSEGDFAVTTKKFIVNLRKKINFPVEIVEEAVSTIEANLIFKNNQKKTKKYKETIDSIAAAVILRRALGL